MRLEKQRMMSETIKDLMPETPDLNAERLAKLKSLFPDLFTDEGTLSETELKKLVDAASVNETERYEFRWFGKSEAKRTAFTPTRATLNRDEARSVNAEASENIIIEGENLEVLKLLLCAYREGVKCIYIDPPYNTGKDFVYSDNYTENRQPYWEQTGVTEAGVKIDTNNDSAGRFHSNWLNMMYSRLLVARQLLRKDGVIFISIDDNEVHNLRRLCNEVFGEENFLGLILWKKKTNGNNMGFIPPVHDYLIVYAKNYEHLSDFGFPVTQDYINKNYSNPDSDKRGLWTTMDLSANHKGPYFGIVNPKTSEEHFPTDGRYWVFNEQEVKKRIKEGRIIFGKSGTSRPIQKVFLNEREGKRFKAESWWDKHGMNEDATEELRQIFDVAKLFDHSKPSKLVKNLISINTSKDSSDEIILDFFAGTGVTGQAVMELNEEDGGNRKFILVQLPELTDEKSEAFKAGYTRISDITIERNRRVVAKLTAAKRAKHPNLFESGDGKDALKDLGFKVFQLEKSYFPRTEWTPDSFASEAENVLSLKRYIAEKESQLHIDFDRDKLLTEILLKEGFKLNYSLAPYEAVTSNRILLASDGDQEALICLDPTLDTETVQHFKTHNLRKFICLERALDTTKKWNLNNFLGEKFKAF